MRKTMLEAGLPQVLILLVLVSVLLIVVPAAMNWDAEPLLWLSDVRIEAAQDAGDVKLTFHGANFFGVDTLYLDGKAVDMRDIQVRSYEEMSAMVDAQELCFGQWQSFQVSKKSPHPLLRMYSDVLWIELPSAY